MISIAIIGAVPSGLLLGIGLLKNGFAVTLVNNKTAKDISQGRVLSSSALFKTALHQEKALGLNFWENKAPKNTAITFALADQGTKALSWQGIVDDYYQAVDQRLKIPAWLDEFEKQGGVLIIKNTTLKDLDNLAKTHELIIVASGKGDISNLFDINPTYTKFSKPQRALALAYVFGMKPAEAQSGVRINIIPGIGEYFSMPGLTHHGLCEMMLFESIIGGKADIWHNIHSPERQLEATIKLLKRYVPWEAERCTDIQLTDNNATLSGQFTPTIRHPVAYLPSGKPILGMADTVVLNDLIGGQGANNAVKCATVYLESILDQGMQTYSKRWMIHTFDKFWQKAHATVKWTNMLLTPPQPHVQELLAAATNNQNLANMLANSFDDVSQLYPWIEQPDKTKAMIERYTKLSLSSTLHNQTKTINQDSPQLSQHITLDTILKENTAFVDAFKITPLLRLIKTSSMADKKVRVRLLACIQTFSDYFQKTVMLRSILTEHPQHRYIADQHLSEEFGHNQALLAYRNHEPPLCDPILEASSCWFAWKMLTLDNIEKTLLMHLVLEASAHIFFVEAHKVMQRYGDTDYFKIHAELDDGHEEMGIEALKGLSEEEYIKLLYIQQQGWDMLYTACNRIAKVTSEEKTNLELSQILNLNQITRKNLKIQSLELVKTPTHS